MVKRDFRSTVSCAPATESKKFRLDKKDYYFRNDVFNMDETDKKTTGMSEYSFGFN